MPASSVAIEPFAGRHLEGVLGVLEAALTADAISRSAFVRKVLLDPSFDPQGAPVAVADGTVVGFALGLVVRRSQHDAPSETGSGYLTLLAVHPTIRRQGIGSALLEHTEEYLLGRGASRCLVSPYAPNYFTPGVDITAYADGLEFLLRRGYRVLSRPVSMQCDLTRLSMPAWLVRRQAELARQGIVVEPYTAQRVPALFEFLTEHFAPDWQRFARTAIEAIETGDSPERLWVASRGERVIGFSHHALERFGPIGVAPDERGQGVGHALMYATLHSMRRAGLHVAWFLWSDDRTAARLYLGAGFTVHRRFAVLGKELHP